MDISPPSEVPVESNEGRRLGDSSQMAAVRSGNPPPRSNAENVSYRPLGKNVFELNME